MFVWKSVELLNVCCAFEWPSGSKLLMRRVVRTKNLLLLSKLAIPIFVRQHQNSFIAIKTSVCLLYSHRRKSLDTLFAWGCVKVKGWHKSSNPVFFLVDVRKYLLTPEKSEMLLSHVFRSQERITI